MVPLIIFGLLIGLPILEVYTFIQVGKAIDVWPTIGLVLLSAAVGTALIRWQGVAVWLRAQQALARGEMPLREVFDGVCLLLAGALLLTPGFVTDAMGLILILPPVRMVLLAAVIAGVRSGRIRTSKARPSAFSTASFSRWDTPAGDRADSTVVEGDYRDVTPETTDGPPSDSTRQTSGLPPHRP